LVARYQVLCEAAAKSDQVRGKLEHILTDLFDYITQNRELMRICFATMFAAPGEVPENLDYADKCDRNFEFIHSLIKTAQSKGELDARFDSREMAFGFSGLANFYVVSHLVGREHAPDKKAAKNIVELFLSGASPKKLSE